MKNLVIYFSEFGSTEVFAKMIHDKVGGDLIKLKPTKPYMHDYDALAKYSKKERDDNARPDFEALDIDINEYDNIFVGYPVWWYTYPMIFRTFFDKYDVSGKNIIPFNTHEGSGDGGIYKELQRDLPHSKVLKGLPIRGGDVSEKQRNKINDWLSELGF